MKNILLLVILSCFFLVSYAQQNHIKDRVKQIGDSIQNETEIKNKLLIFNSAESQQLQKENFQAQVLFVKYILDYYVAAGDKANAQEWLKKMEKFGMFYGLSLNSWYSSFYKKGEYAYIDSYMTPKMDSICSVLESGVELDKNSYTEYSLNLPKYVANKLELQDYKGAYKHLNRIYVSDNGFSNNINYIQYAKVLINMGRQSEGIDLIAKQYVEGHRFNKDLENIKNQLLADVNDGEQKFQHALIEIRKREKDNYTFVLNNFTELYGKDLKKSLVKPKYILLSFWGTWCIPCIQSHPKLIELYGKYNNQGFEILGIASETGKDRTQVEDNLKKSIESQQLPWLQIMLTQATKRVTVDYGIKAFPTKVLIDNEGNIIAKFIGNDAEKIESVLKEVLAKR